VLPATARRNYTVVAIELQYKAVTEIGEIVSSEGQLNHGAKWHCCSLPDLFFHLLIATRKSKQINTTVKRSSGFT
jgi:hypothetical protein